MSPQPPKVLSMPTQHITQIITQLQQQFEGKFPPVASWNPPLSGEMDMRIDREGRWYHEGEEIKRQPMIKMFSSILKREGDDYFLVTPVEKWKIQVEIAPLLMTSLSVEKNEAGQFVVLTSNVGDKVLLSSDNKLWMEEWATEGQLPLVSVRSGLNGLISRNVFYEMIETLAQQEGGRYFIESSGEKFWLEA
jgi:uncharacterized protein